MLIYRKVYIVSPPPSQWTKTAQCPQLKQIITKYYDQRVTRCWIGSTPNPRRQSSPAWIIFHFWGDQKKPRTHSEAGTVTEVSATLVEQMIFRVQPPVLFVWLHRDWESRSKMAGKWGLVLLGWNVPWRLDENVKTKFIYEKLIFEEKHIGS